MPSIFLGRNRYLSYTMLPELHLVSHRVLVGIVQLYEVTVSMLSFMHKVHPVGEG